MGYQIVTIITTIIDFNMARRKLRDNLHRAARNQAARLDKYQNLRPQVKFASMRIKRMEFLLDNGLHQKFIKQAYNLMFENTLAGRLMGGLRVLQIVRDVLLNLGLEVRSNSAASPSFDNKFQALKLRSEVHPFCPLMRKLPQQIEMLQMVASEMESFAIMLYVDEKLVKSGQLQDNNRFQSIDYVFVVNKAVEKALNDLRMIRLS